MRIPSLLQDERVAFEAVPHAPAFTAQRLAKYLHVPGSRVAKAILLYGPAGFVLGVLPATRRVDLEVLTRLLGGPVRLATDTEAAAIFCDCEWGVVPPFGAFYGLPTLLDESMPADEMLVFEANTHFEAVRLLCRDFERLERPRRLAFARRADLPSHLEKPGGPPDSW
jgi:Ala-tRNA(Pro) deacylase